MGLDPAGPGAQALERLPHGVLIVRDGRISFCNEQARALLLSSALADRTDATWPVGREVAATARFLDDAGEALQLPTQPPEVGDRYAEHLVHLQTSGSPRPLVLEGAWSDGDLVLTLRNAARRDSAVRLQGDVVATVAHEIRSPLTSVKGFTRTLLSRWDRFSDEQKLTMLATIEQDADRVTRLLTDLLEVSRIDAGRVKLQRSVVDVAALASSVADKARVRTSQPQIEVVIEPVDAPAADPGTVDPGMRSISADRDKLEQVLTNLVDNALQHAPGSPVRIIVSPGEQQVRISVADQGPGVDPATSAGLFRKFGRGRDAARSGTGLGLFLTKGLVEAHGGRIWFDAVVEVGATVQVELPRRAG